MLKTYQTFDEIIEEVSGYLGIDKETLERMMNGEEINPYRNERDSYELLFGGVIDTGKEKVMYKGLIPSILEIKKKIDDGYDLSQLQEEITEVTTEAFRIGFYFRA